MTEGRRLSDFSRAVRQSTIKRLRTVPEGFELWCPVDGAMSFADLAVHIAEADRWLFRKLQNHDLSPMVGQAGQVQVKTRAEFDSLIDQLDELGKERAELLERMEESQLRKELLDERFEGNVTVWWLIIRGNLDHEAHHRGQIATYLRLVPEA